MSIDLILEVMDHAPAALTSGERLVLVIIAERANDKTRVAKQSKTWTIDTIAHRAGVGRDGLRRIFQRLEKNGCDVRKKLGTDSRGKPVFAYDGTAMTFQVPHLARRDGSTPSEAERRDAGTASDGQEVVPQSARGGTVVRQRWDGSTTQSLMTLKEPSNPSPLPPTEPTAPPGTSTEEGGKEEIDPQTQRINTLVALIAARRPTDRRWTPTTIRKAITDCLADGRTLDAIEHAFPLCEADPDTGSPGRLKLAFPWWDDNTDCDRCHNQRTIAGEYTTGPRTIPCPDCRRTDLHNERCPQHPREAAWNCATCRAARLATCPHPDHDDNAFNCGYCWSHVRARQDPFEHYEHLRPKRWFDTYGATLNGQAQPALPAKRRPKPPCGRPTCRDGWYELGRDRRRCHLCPEPTNQEIECVS